MTNKKEFAAPNKVPSSRLQLLDLTRFIAALMVVAFHWTYNGLQNGKITANLDPTWISQFTQFGFWGVTLFFLISGFVITHSVHGKTPREFVTTRLTRLYPAFWVAVILTSAVTLLAGHPSLEVGARQVLYNLTMIPSVFGHSFVDGVYWTLEVELAFYAVVLVAMFTIGAHRLTSLMMVWIGVLAAFSVIDVIAPGAIQPPWLLDAPFAAFATGAVVAAIVFDRGTWLRWLAATVGTSVLIRDEILVAVERGEIFGWEPAPIGVAILILAFVGVLLMQKSERVRGWVIPGSRLLGNLTYPLYLLHAHLGYIALSAWATPANYFWLYPTLFAAALVGSWLLHEFVEYRPRVFWKKFFGGTAGRLVGWMWDGRQLLAKKLRDVVPARRKWRAQQHEVASVTRTDSQNRA